MSDNPLIRLLKKVGVKAEKFRQKVLTVGTPKREPVLPHEVPNLAAKISAIHRQPGLFGDAVDRVLGMTDAEIKGAPLATLRATESIIIATTPLPKMTPNEYQTGENVRRREAAWAKLPQIAKFALDKNSISPEDITAAHKILWRIANIGAATNRKPPSYNGWKSSP